jgi:arabinan endo-1,5-alpha-L-arabinosidase
MKHDGYYYLFFQRGLCCRGVDSTYYVQVGRSKSVTGPYLDRDGTDLRSSGGSDFLPNRGNGRIVGPGHLHRQRVRPG